MMFYPEDAGTPAKLEGQGWGELADAPSEAIMILSPAADLNLEFDVFLLPSGGPNRLHPAREMRNPEAKWNCWAIDGQSRSGVRSK